VHTGKFPVLMHIARIELYYQLKYTQLTVMHTVYETLQSDSVSLVSCNFMSTFWDLSRSLSV
jgi:hypothetical protein